MNISAFLFYVLVVSFTPGPNNILSLANAGKVGYKRTVPFMLGISMGVFSLFILTLMFGMTLYENFPGAKDIMGLVGAVYMLYLSYKIIHEKYEISEGEDCAKKDSEQEVPQGSMANKARKVSTFRDGFLMQVINPKTIMFTATLMSNFLIPNYPSTVALIGFSVVLSMEVYLAVSSWALFGLVYKKFFYEHREIFNVVMSLLLIYSAATVSGLLH